MVTVLISIVTKGFVYLEIEFVSLPLWNSWAFVANLKLQPAVQTSVNPKPRMSVG